MTGRPKPGEPGNRFSDSPIARLPVPLPLQYVRGIDLQKEDMENHRDRSYLRGEWKQGGWWYYYLYGLAVKMPNGSQIILFFAALKVVRSRFRGVPMGETGNATALDIAALLAPPLTLLVLVSSQVEFNHHFRYVLPVFGFLFVFSGASASLVQPCGLGEKRRP